MATSPPPIMYGCCVIHSSVFELAIVKAMIRRLSFRVGHNIGTKESDFTAIIFAIINYKLDNSVEIISPESWNDNDYNRTGRCDGLVCRVNLDKQSPSYGSRIPRIMFEGKNHGARGWNYIFKNQIWEQTDATKNPNGRNWALVLKGFEVCVFWFDVTMYTDRGDFENFKPLNLNNWSEQDLIYIGADPLVETINGTKYIQVIRWKLNDSTHWSYIEAMIDYILRHNP